MGTHRAMGNECMRTAGSARSLCRRTRQQLRMGWGWSWRRGSAPGWRWAATADGHAPPPGMKYRRRIAHLEAGIAYPEADGVPRNGGGECRGSCARGWAWAATGEAGDASGGGRGVTSARGGGALGAGGEQRGCAGDSKAYPGGGRQMLRMWMGTRWYLEAAVRWQLVAAQTWMGHEGAVPRRGDGGGDERTRLWTDGGGDECSVGGLRTRLRLRMGMGWGWRWVHEAGDGARGARKPPCVVEDGGDAYLEPGTPCVRCWLRGGADDGKGQMMTRCRCRTSSWSSVPRIAADELDIKPDTSRRGDKERAWLWVWGADGDASAAGAPGVRVAANAPADVDGITTRRTMRITGRRRAESGAVTRASVECCLREEMGMEM
ncbi:hypothetical protein C8R45DRAFT_1070293 [Mycena sanguinolenta]|nr:hypothetical protein C8R45DRAFT_1070293 [Mycena sanguinolenta]